MEILVGDHVVFVSFGFHPVDEVQVRGDVARLVQVTHAVGDLGRSSRIGRKRDT